MEGLRGARRQAQENKEREKYKEPLDKSKNLDFGEHQLTRAEIMQDRDEQHRFLQMLHAKKSPETVALVEAIVDNTLLDDAQHKLIEKHIVEYNARRAEMSQLEKVFTTEFVELIADSNKDIHHMVSEIGMEKAHALLLKQFEQLSLENPKGYEKVLESMRNEKMRSEGAWKEYTNHVDSMARKALRNIGISEDELTKLTTKSLLRKDSTFDPSERIKLEEEARKHMGLLMRIADGISGKQFSKNRAEEYIKWFRDQKDFLRDSDKNYDVIGKALAATITPEMRLEMQRISMSGGELKDDTNVKSIADCANAKKELKDRFDDDAVTKRLRSHLKAEAIRLNKTIKSFTHTERDAALDSFADKEDASQREKKGRGIFAAFLALIFKPKADIRSQADRLWT